MTDPREGMEVFSADELDKLPEAIVAFAPLRGARLAAQRGGDQWVAVGGPEGQVSGKLAKESFPILVLWIPDPDEWEFDAD